jgi:SAM-dependent methyltransferase
MIKLLRRRLPFLQFPLHPNADSVDTTEPDGDLREHAAKARYSLRLQRYWWAACKISEEVESTDQTYVVVDLGCERGWLKRFTRPNPRIRWIGLDGNTSHPSLAASEYDEIVCCNFSRPLPLPDGCADAVVSLHVFEHLHDADLAASEVARILKPGGVFLAGTPGCPSPIASVRSAFLRRRERLGRNRPWGHVRAFSPSAWSRLCNSAGLSIEFVTGSHLIRRTGAAMESNRMWIRANQIWGGLFPSLGSELYVSARKPLESQLGAVKAGLLERFWFKADWAGPIAATLILAFTIHVLLTGPASSEDTSFATEIQSLKDDIDVFAWAVGSRDLSRHTADRSIKPRTVVTWTPPFRRPRPGDGSAPDYRCRATRPLSAFIASRCNPHQCGMAKVRPSLCRPHQRAGRTDVAPVC